MTGTIRSKKYLGLTTDVNSNWFTILDLIRLGECFPKLGVNVYCGLMQMLWMSQWAEKEPTILYYILHYILFRRL